MSLSRIQSLRIGTVLEDCSHQLDILGHCLTVQIRKEHGNTPEENRLIKIKSDCEFISRQMSQLSLELENEQSFSSLLQAVEKTEREKINTQTDLEQKKQMELRQQKILDKQDELKELTSVYKELRVKVVEKKLENFTLGVDDEDDIMDGMIHQTKTQKAETKQTEAEHLQNEIQDKLKLLQTQLTEEKGAHEDAMKFLQNRNKELQQQLNSWKQRSEEMLQDKQNQVHTIKHKRTLNSDKREELEREIKEMEQVVMEDMKEKERLLQQEAEIRAATKLQAWWRGCMVRRGLGAFKKAKDKKTKKKKGKNKKVKKKK